VNKSKEVCKEKEEEEEEEEEEDEKEVIESKPSFRKSAKDYCDGLHILLAIKDLVE
jgi:hypothetical protein